MASKVFKFTTILFLILIQKAENVGNLKYFETFSAISVLSRVKRSQTGQQLIKELKFKVLQRTFHLTLKSGTKVLADDFLASLVESDGRLTTFHIDQSHIYSGHLSGNMSVHVSAHIEDNLWTIMIYEHNDTYNIEPAKNLLNESDNPLNHTLVGYRNSDLSEKLGKCGTLQSMSNDWLKQDVKNGSKNHTVRRKRWMVNGYRRPKVPRNPLMNTCVISIIGDYDLFSKRCHSNYLTCSALMISMVEYADKVFRSSKFVDNENTIYRNIGLQIGYMVLYSTPTYSADSYMPHFNAKGIEWNAFSKLNSLQYFLSYRNRKFCLTHLLTSYPMPGRILGIADINGLCAVSRRGGYVKSSAFSSTIDSYAGPLTTFQLKQVFVHAHNFGSEHDTEIPECSQIAQMGGTYIMWERIGSGMEPNNKVFSFCTLRSIGEQLATAPCLQTRSQYSTFCGNGIVDTGEECDAGATGLINADICCDRNCQLYENAMCSDMNTQCCVNCYLAGPGAVCYDHTTVACKKKSYCTGKNFTCPDPKNMPDWTPCLDGGLCHDGICKGFCEIKSVKENMSLKACMCQSPEEDVCKWCCYDNQDPLKPGPCVAHSSEILRDGRPCHFGYCQSGVCKSVITSRIRRIAAYIKSVPRTGYIKFLRSNIVLLVVSSSLTLWYLQVLYVRHFARLLDTIQQSTLFDEPLIISSTAASPQNLHENVQMSQVVTSRTSSAAKSRSSTKDHASVIFESHCSSVSRVSSSRTTGTAHDLFEETSSFAFQKSNN